MSLDVYLTVPDAQHIGERIFIRENGQNKEITRAEWDAHCPGQEPIAVVGDETNEVYSANITHNLAHMAREADIYFALWCPDEIGITLAAQLIEPLTAGLAFLKATPDHFRSFNPANGWGDYDGLVDFVAAYLAACKAHPTATVSVWR